MGGTGPQHRRHHSFSWCFTNLKEQEVRQSLTNRPTLVHASVEISLTQNAMKYSFPCWAVKSCPLVNDCDLLAGFSDFYLPFSHLTPSIRGIPSSYRVHIWCGKTRMAEQQCDEGRIMIDSVWRLGTVQQRDRQSHVAIANAVPYGKPFVPLRRRPITDERTDRRHRSIDICLFRP